jgi:DNA-binding transcriptional MerR regulator
MEGFTALQASRFTGSTGNQLRYWDKIGLVKPGVQETGGRPGVRRMYSFRDLIALKVVKSLLDGGMSLQRVRRAYGYLRQNAKLEEHLSSVKLVTDGKSIFKICKDEGEILDALRQGQMAFFVAIDKLAVEVRGGVSEFLRDREQFVRTLRTVEHELELETLPSRGRPRRRTSA